jgi:Rrf2 family protein
LLSQTVEYALRAVVFLASHSPAARTTEDIAAGTLVPRAYLSKILQGLVRAKILVSRRGVGGGVALAKTPQALSMLDVVNAVEPIVRIRVCPLGIETHGKRLCLLHRKLDAALADMEKAFASTTLADVLSGASGVVPLCEVPKKARNRAARAI